jgi:lipopolysaccharide biosynthesis glycosyltransferase
MCAVEFLNGTNERLMPSHRFQSSGADMHERINTAEPRSDISRHPVVVLAADEQFAMPLATTVRSALENLSPEAKLRIFVLDGGITDHTKERVVRSWPAGRFEIAWLSVDASALRCPMSMQGSLACYFRILIPRVLPGSITRVIYLDSDLFIAADLALLWSQELAGNLCLAVQDCGAPFIDSSQALSNFNVCAPYIYYPRPIPNFQQLGLDPASAYFNSGVLVVDVDGWRREDVTSQLVECLTKNAEHVHLWDQYALNVVLAGRWGGLDRRWNQGLHVYQFPSWEVSPYDRETFEQQREDPYIVHYTTSHKPWKASCQHPLKQRFLDCIQRTDWAGWRLSRTEIALHILKTQERRFRHGRRWLRDQARQIVSRSLADRLRKAG